MASPGQYSSFGSADDNHDEQCQHPESYPMGNMASAGQSSSFSSADEADNHQEQCHHPESYPLRNMALPGQYSSLGSADEANNHQEQLHHPESYPMYNMAKTPQQSGQQPRSDSPEDVEVQEQSIESDGSGDNWNVEICALSLGTLLTFILSYGLYREDAKLMSTWDHILVTPNAVVSCVVMLIDFCPDGPISQLTDSKSVSDEVYRQPASSKSYVCQSARIFLADQSLIS